nr:hypothetical protein [candidate division Zixibacteria bacterium]
MKTRLSSLALTIVLMILIVFSIRCDSDNGVVDNGSGEDTTQDTTGNPVGNLLADHNAAADFDLIPTSYLQTIKENLKLYYGHTSHGSQIVRGLIMLEEEDTMYNRPYYQEVSDDLGSNGDTSWAPITRTYLNAHPDINMVMWSWCGGCSVTDEAGINIYLAKMSELEQAYPGVVFIYMTGHLDGGGVDGALYTSNNRIRDYCDSTDRILFDFADIESYDPDGTYYPDEADSCGWCYEWCDENDCADCASCAHSHCFNCYQKGKAFWWLLARIYGWDGN